MEPKPTHWALKLLQFYYDELVLEEIEGYLNELLVVVERGGWRSGP